MTLKFHGSLTPLLAGLLGCSLLTHPLYAAETSPLRASCLPEGQNFASIAPMQPRVAFNQSPGPALPASLTWEDRCRAFARNLRGDFRSAKDLDAVNLYGDLPADIVARLNARFPPRMAELGESWDSGDVSFPDRPRTQHLLSLVSDAIVAVLYQSGGWEITQHLLLLRRDAMDTCRYDLKEFKTGLLTTIGVQSLAQNDSPCWLEPMGKPE